MRIDYHEPKQSYTSSQQKSRPQRTEKSGSTALLIVLVGILTFSGGFGAGWFFSQKAAKRSFQAAMEQKSIENSPHSEPAVKPAAPPAPSAPPSPSTTSPHIPQPGTAPGGPQPVQEPALSFYKTLPSGQKSNVLGSGINTKDDKSKQPLQAAIPSNLAKPQPQTEPQRQVDKTAVRQEAAGFTVQIASYSLKSEAESLKAKLMGKGYSAFISESNQGEKGVWYRVRVGRKLEQDAAKELAGKLGKGALAIPDRD